MPTTVSWKAVADHPGIALIELDGPDRLNALGTEAGQGLKAAAGQISADPSVRVVIVAGKGRLFCAGADIVEMRTFAGPDQFHDFVAGLAEAFDAIAALAAPTIAAVQGAALGGGLELSLACDLRVVEANARLGLPEIRLGVLPAAGGTQRTTRLLPPALVKELLLTGEPLAVDRAYALGLVNRVVEPGTALEGALALADIIAAQAPQAAAAATRLVDQGLELPLGQAIALERETVTDLFSFADRVEGMSAFLEKRPPRWTGR
jgi:enoyl-CoA hydratase